MHRNYVKRLIESPLPPLAEDERIYLKVPYMARSFAKYCHCGFDSENKLWFTGAYNFNLRGLVEMYEVDESTSDNARCLLGIALETVDRDELMVKIQKYYDDKKSGGGIGHDYHPSMGNHERDPWQHAEADERGHTHPASR